MLRSIFMDGGRSGTTNLPAAQQHKTYCKSTGKRIMNTVAPDLLALQRLYRWEGTARDRVALTQPMGNGVLRDLTSVSYTHLTLPTNREV